MKKEATQNERSEEKRPPMKIEPTPKHKGLRKHFR
jgi:hypothetical protein